MSVILLVLVIVAKYPSSIPGALTLFLLGVAALGLVHLMVANVVEIVFILREIGEDKKPFSRNESKRLPDLIHEEVSLSKIDPEVVDHVIASLETNAAILQTNLNWMKGCVLGGAAGIVTVLFQGSTLRSMLERWVSSAMSTSAQGVLLIGFITMFVLYVTLWRRIVRSENRARYLKFIRGRRSFLLSLDSKVIQ